MSKYTKYKTEYDDKECLIQSLIDAGYERHMIEVNEQLHHLYGYKGDRRNEKAHIIIRKNHVGVNANDIGFEMIDGKYVAHISEYDKTYTYNQLTQNKVQAHYKKNAILKLKKKGKKIKEKNENGKIELLIEI